MPGLSIILGVLCIAYGLNGMFRSNTRMSNYYGVLFGGVSFIVLGVLGLYGLIHRGGGITLVVLGILVLGYGLNRISREMIGVLFAGAAFIVLGVLGMIDVL